MGAHLCRQAVIMRRVWDIAELYDMAQAAFWRDVPTCLLSARDRDVHRTNYIQAQNLGLHVDVH